MRERELPSVHEHHLTGCLFTFVSGSLFLFAIAAVLTYAAWKNDNRHVAPMGYAGDPQRGKVLVSNYGCASCHVIPGATPGSVEGPSLVGIASRSYIAGRFANHEISMTLWLEDPPRLKPGTSMPNLAVGRRDALDMAAYLAELH